MKGFQSSRIKGKGWCYQPCPLHWTKFHASHSRALPNLDSSHISHIWCFPSCFPLGGVYSQRRIIKTFQPRFPAAFWPFSFRRAQNSFQGLYRSFLLFTATVQGDRSFKSPQHGFDFPKFVLPFPKSLPLNSQWSFGLNLQTWLYMADVKRHTHKGKTMNPLQSECPDPVISLP